MKEIFLEIRQIRGMLNVRECMFLNRLAEKVVVDSNEGAVLCEIGSFCGKSTVSIAKALVKHNAGTLYAVDWHEGSPSLPGFEIGEYKSTYSEYLQNIEKFDVSKRIRTIKKKSEDSVGDVPQQIHFLWIDGLHSYNGVKADYSNYEGKLIKGGFLLFHDACWTTWVSPFRFIKDEVLNNPNYNFYAMTGNTIIFKKEDNRMGGLKKRILSALCEFVSGENRPWYKKVVSFILFRLTTYYTVWFHNWYK